MDYVEWHGMGGWGRQIYRRGGSGRCAGEDGFLSGYLREGAHRADREPDPEHLFADSEGCCLSGDVLADPQGV